MLAARVGPGLFRLLGLSPRVGRGFLPQNADRGGVVVISDSLWRRAFGADPQDLGRQLCLKDRTATVVGVMPRGLAFPFADPAVEAWFPLGRTPEPGDSPIVHVVARLRPGLTAASAQPLLDGAAKGIQKARPARVPWGATLDPIDPRRWSRADHSMVFVAFGAVGFVPLAARGKRPARRTRRRDGHPAGVLARPADSSGGAAGSRTIPRPRYADRLASARVRVRRLGCGGAGERGAARDPRHRARGADTADDHGPRDEPHGRPSPDARRVHRRAGGLCDGAADGVGPARDELRSNRRLRSRVRDAEPAGRVHDAAAAGLRRPRAPARLLRSGSRRRS